MRWPTMHKPVGVLGARVNPRDQNFVPGFSAASAACTPEPAGPIRHGLCCAALAWKQLGGCSGRGARRAVRPKACHCGGGKGGRVPQWLVGRRIGHPMPSAISLCDLSVAQAFVSSKSGKAVLWRNRTMTEYWDLSWGRRPMLRNTWQWRHPTG